MDTFCIGSINLTPTHKCGEEYIKQPKKRNKHDMTKQ